MATFDQFIQSLREEFGEQDAGKKFEIFCKWFLKNDTEWSKTVDEVWLWSEYPDKWQRKDLGTDLVFRDKDGFIWAVQAKCYDEKYPTTKKDMNTFLADSGRKKVDRRLWLQTTNKMAKEASDTLKDQDKPVTIFNLNDFRNAHIVYPKSYTELYQAKVKIKPTPDPHQNEAVEAVQSKLQTLSRAQMIMACGTGKTFTTLWIKEALKTKNTLVLLPSLSLLSQTMREWAWASNTDFEILNVCSDKSVGKKTEDMKVSDAPFPVTSKVPEIIKFLKKPQPKVIFCTYQSSALIADAQQDFTVPYFDLTIADEAHRCAGRVEASFATILDEEKIRSHKRLFCTATPRYFGRAVKNLSITKDITIVGMDDQRIFGPIIHQLTFGEAIRRDLLNDYQTVIIGVDQPMVKQWIDNYEIIATNPDETTDARTLAAKIGLIKAIKIYNIKRIISFHSRVEGAKKFSEELVDIVDLINPNHKPEGTFLTDYVSGKMNAGDRKEKIDRLKILSNHDRGVLTNARCLAEGVDVPSLDGVAFIDPKSSQIEIIQAVGRAIRKVRGVTAQTKGTIVIPVFIEAGDDIEASIANSNFKPVWDVLKALRAHDEVLADELDQCRTRMAKAPSHNRETISDKVIFDIPTSIDVEFSNALRAITVEATTASWEFWYGLLQVFKKREGHCKVKTEHFEGAYNLGSWVKVNRSLKKTLPKDRLERLNSIGFIWDPFFDDWIKAYNLYVEYIEKYKTRPKNKLKYKGFGLAGWAQKQASEKQKGLLDKNKIDILNEIDFQWEYTNEIAHLHLDAVKIFYEKFNTFSLTKSQKKKYQPVQKAISYLRKNYENLSPEILDSLNKINFSKQVKAGWDDIFKVYKSLFGNIEHVPTIGKKYEGFDLYRWHRRMVADWDNLDTIKQELLLEIGFDPYVDITSYRSKKNTFTELDQTTKKEKKKKTTQPRVSFIKINPDVASIYKKFISPSSTYSDFENKNIKELLIQFQKQLSDDQRDELMLRGIFTTKYHKQWFLNFSKYKLQIQDIKESDLDSELLDWETRQRANKKNLSQIRTNLLTSINFEFDKSNKSWEKKVKFIREYKKKHANLDIPADVMFEGKSIRSWLLRTLSRKDEINESLSSALIELGVYDNWPSTARTPPSKKDTFEYNYPELLKFWDHKKNLPNKPSHFTSGSKEIVWWKCLDKDCLESYDYAIEGKTKNGWGCPYCSGQRTRAKDSLKIKYPKLANQWDIEKNGNLRPIDVLPGSSRKVYWLCDDGCSFQKHIRNRALRGQTKCTVCKKAQDL